MKKRYHFIVFISLAILFASCNPSMQAFKKGNYYDATLKAVKQLRNNPDSKNALEVIQKSYPMELDYEKQRIKELSISNHPDKYFNITETYSRLNNLADEISRCPAALEVLKPVVYFHEQLKKAEELAWDEQFEAAKRLMDTGKYLDARLAVSRLEWVKEQNPNYSNLKGLLDEAYDLATLKTVVRMKPELHSNYDINSNPFYQHMFDFLDKSLEKDFVRFYQPDLAKKIRLNPNEILTFQFLEFQIGTLSEKEKEAKYESDSLVVGTYTNQNGEEYNVYGTVKAVVKTHEHELPAKALMEVQVIDANSNEILVSRKFHSDYVWRNSWAVFNGDERAVPADLFSLTKRKQQMPPPPQEMFLLTTEPIVNDASQFLRSYYRKK